MLAHVLSFGRNSRGSPDLLAYPVPKACMHVLGTGVPMRLGVARSASSPKATLALGCSLTPGLRISFGRVICLSARAMDTGFPIFVWHLCMGPGCAWVWVLVSPPALAWVLVWCVWVGVEVAPFFSRLGFAVIAAGLGFRPASHHSWLRFLGVRGCVQGPPVVRRSRFGCAVWLCVLGFGFRLAPPLPGA